MANINVNQAAVPEVGTVADDTFTWGAGGAGGTGIGREGNDTFNMDVNGVALNNRNQAFGEAGDDRFNVNTDFNFADGGAGNDYFVRAAFANGNTFSGGDGTDGLKIVTGGGGVIVTANNDGTGEFNFGNAATSSTFLSIEAFELTTDGDIFNGSTRNETVLGGTGGDLLNGGGGNDYLLGTTFAAGGGLVNDTAKNVLNGGDGNDVVIGASRGDVMNGGSGNDVIVSFSSNDGGVNGVLDGGTGDDIMLAGAAGDTIYGGASGLDYTRLGVGDDTVQVDGKAQWLMIDAFQAGAGNEDQIIVSSQSGISTFDQLLSHAVEFTGSNGAFGTLIRFDNGNVIYLNGVHKSSLAANDFDFTNAAFS